MGLQMPATIRFLLEALRGWIQCFGFWPGALHLWARFLLRSICSDLQVRPPRDLLQSKMRSNKSTQKVRQLPLMMRSIFMRKNQT